MMKITLEDNKEYKIIDEIEIDKVKYLYLCNSEDEMDVCIRKKSRDEREVLGLDNEKEYEKALNAYTQKYRDLFDN